MAERDCDIVIVGAGVAGLAAAAELDRAGFRIVCLEARDRLGGRILTLHEPESPASIELGAEFVHGRPPEINSIAAEAGLVLEETTGEPTIFEWGRLLDPSASDDPGSRVMESVEQIRPNGEDETFLHYLDRHNFSESERRWAIAHVEGFNAARKEDVSVAWLAEERRAASRIDGDRAFHVLNGYDGVPQAFYRRVADAPRKVRLSSIVDRVRWRAGEATVGVLSATGDKRWSLRSRAVLITLPLPLLQAEPGEAGPIAFDPKPENILDAARQLRYGQAVRVVLRFDRPVREEHGMLLSDEPEFPTWWMPHPDLPLMVGWSAGPKADKLLGCDLSTVTARALRSLTRLLGPLQARLEHSYFHDWHADRFARCAYSHVPAGALPARRALTEPVDGTLFFAGEATDLSGHTGTVHGAIASGLRAARQIQAALVRADA